MSPQLVSRYNQQYYCTILGYKTNAVTNDGVPVVTIDLVVRGDMSLGPLQRPSDSTLRSWVTPRLALHGETIHEEDEHHIRATLTFHPEAVGEAERHMQGEPPGGPFYYFTFGAGGYSEVRLL